MDRWFADMEDTRKKIVFIINPVSGTRGKHNIPELIFKLIDSKLYDPEIRFTEGPGHARELALRMAAKKVPYVVAVGGDGTVNEVASALRGSSSALGIIPLGSGNGLARDLFIPLEPRRAIKMLNHAVVKSIDYGLANDRPFFSTCGFGFDAYVGWIFEKSGQRGFLSYSWAFLRAVFSYRHREYTFQIDGKSFVEQAVLVTIANSSQFGYNACVAPAADLQDGMLNLVIVQQIPLFHAPDLVFRIFTRTLDKSRYVRSIPVKELKVQRQRRGLSHIDGDCIVMGENVVIEVVPRGLQVMTSAKKMHQEWKSLLDL